MSWSKSFADPIELPNGRVLRTLRDAGHYVTSLWKADQAKPHWQTAARELTMAAERGGNRLCPMYDLQPTPIAAV